MTPLSSFVFICYHLSYYCLQNFGLIIIYSCSCAALLSPAGFFGMCLAIQVMVLVFLFSMLLLLLFSSHRYSFLVSQVIKWLLSMAKFSLSSSICCMCFVLDCLGPDYHFLRCSAKLAAHLSDRMDLLLELLRWYCVNACEDWRSQLHPSIDHHPLVRMGVYIMGCIPKKCGTCLRVRKQRVIFRYHHGEEYKYICGHCLAYQVSAWIFGSDDFLCGDSFRAKDRRMFLIFFADQMSFRGILGEALQACAEPHRVCLSATHGHRTARVLTKLSDDRDSLAILLRWYCRDTWYDNYYSPSNPLGCIGIKGIGRFWIKCSGCLTSCEQWAMFWYNYSGGRRYVCGGCLADDMLLWLVSSEEHARMDLFFAEHRFEVVTCLACKMGFGGSFGAALNVVQYGEPEWDRITATLRTFHSSLADDAYAAGAAKCAEILQRVCKESAMSTQRGCDVLRMNR